MRFILFKIKSNNDGFRIMQICEHLNYDRDSIIRVVICGFACKLVGDVVVSDTRYVAATVDTS